MSNARRCFFPGDGILAVIDAFFDESERASGLFAVAGYLFAPEQARKFSKEWFKLLGGRAPFHMVDLTARREAFGDLSRVECNDLLKRAVVLINKRIIAAVAVSCSLPEIEGLLPNWIASFDSAYAVCCHFCMTGVGTWMRDSGRRDKVTYVFEAGHPSQTTANGLITRIGQLPADAGDPYRYHGHTFQPKASSAPLQAADLFAWEWAKFRDETLDQGLRPLRQSLRALIKPDTKRYQVYHLTGEPLRDFARGVERLGLEQLREER
jgi:hypothetical protein